MKNHIDRPQLTLLYFYSEQCFACRHMTETLKVPSEFDDVLLIKQNVNEDMEFAEQAGVQSLPTLIVLDNNNEEIHRWPHYIEPKTLRTFLNKQMVVA